LWTGSQGPSFDVPAGVQEDGMGSVAGPLHYYVLRDGTRVPFYVIKFDKQGICVTPKTRAHLTEALAGGTVSDVYLFSHGWNNSPTDAIKRYRGWIEGYQAMHARGGFTLDRPYRPLLIGVVWPSVWIVPWWERGREIARAVGVEDEREAAMVSELAEYVPEAERERFYALTQVPRLSEAEAREFIALLASLYGGGDDDIEEVTGPSVDDLLASWDLLAQSGGATELAPEDRGAEIGARQRAEPESAEAAPRGPVDGIRLFSVWQMKDRAAAVGGNGVADLLRDVLTASGERSARRAARTHLIGHSFGAKVLLSAICGAGRPGLVRPVDSLLLLQPAINQYGLADTVPGRARPGGYHAALAHVAQPILSTFTNDDSPLRDFFHLALRRRDDLGEARVTGDEPPSEYAAMGGYGPQGVRSLGVVDIKSPGQDYALEGNAPQVYGVRAHDKIPGHSDISNDYTYWALYSLVRSS
jgi:hypothetical protein